MAVKFRTITALIKIGFVVLILFSLGSVIAPQGEMGTSPLDSIGMGTSTHLRIGIDQLGSAYQQLEDMNIHWIREEFPWSEIEVTPGQYSFNYDVDLVTRDFDSMIALAKRHDMEVVAVLSGGPTYLYHSYPDQPVDADELISYWQGYVQAVVERYGDQIDYWEIGSEPNNPAEWRKVMFPTVSGAQSTPSPFLYARMLSTAEKIIRTHNRRDTVILGGLYNQPDSDCLSNPIAFLSGLVNAGVWDDFDVIALHPFWQNTPPEVWMQRGVATDISSGDCNPDVQAQSNLVGEIRSVNEFAQAHGEKPIWITGLGWKEDWLSAIGSQNGFSDDQIESNFLVRSIIPLITEDQVKKVFWYSMYDDPNNQGFSLSGQGTIALKNIGRLLGNARPLGQFQESSDLNTQRTSDEIGLFEYRFRKEGRTIIYTWAANGGAIPYQITLENLPGKSYRAYAIDAVDLSTEAGMELEVSEDQSLTIYVNEILALLIEEKTNMISSVKYRIEDGLDNWLSNLKAGANSWVNQQKQILIQKALDWAEGSILNFLNKVVDFVSGD
jgi:hypothetical protein